MARAKKNTFNMIYADMKKDDINELVYSVNNVEFNIPVKRTLGFDEAYGFVDDVVNTCINISNGVYKPESLDFAKRVFTLIYYAGFTEVKDVKKAYNAVYGTDLYRKIISLIDMDQYEVICDAVNKRFEFAKDYMTSVHAAQINDLVTKMDAVMSESEQAIATVSSPEFKTQVKEAITALSNSNVAEESEEDSDNIESDNDNIVVLNRDNI